MCVTSGLRIGKGEGFADLEWAMMSSMGAVNDNTVVVATCHDCQVLDLPESLFGPHDLTVDYILTPTQVLCLSTRINVMSLRENEHWLCTSSSMVVKRVYR